MKNLGDIKLRMKGVSETMQITKAMETVSIAKMRKASQMQKLNADFFKKIKETISDIILHTGYVDNKYMKSRTGERALFVVVSSDKGLCGSYNHNVLEKALEIVKTYDKSKVSIYAIGHMSAVFFARQGYTVDLEFTHVSVNNSRIESGRIADNIISMFDMNLVDEVHVIYTEVEGAGNNVPKVTSLLPLNKEMILGRDKKFSIEEEEYMRELEYDPSPEFVLDNLIKQYLFGVLNGVLIQSSAAEHSSRRQAMSNATNNASDLLDNLRLDYNRARQARVTNEILEITTASNSVQ